MGHVAKHRQTQPAVPLLFQFWGVLLVVSAVAVLAILARPVVAVLSFLLT